MNPSCLCVTISDRPCFDYFSHCLRVFASEGRPWKVRELFRVSKKTSQSDLLSRWLQHRNTVSDCSIPVTSNRRKLHSLSHDRQKNNDILEWLITDLNGSGRPDLDEFVVFLID